MTGGIDRGACSLSTVRPAEFRDLRQFARVKKVILTRSSALQAAFVSDHVLIIELKDK